MAHIRTCKYKFCGKDVINADYHPECRVAFCEDLLARIKSAIEQETSTPTNLFNLFLTLKEEFRYESFQALEDYLINQKDQNSLEGRQRIWELSRMQFVQKASQDWEKDNPEPNPKRC